MATRYLYIDDETQLDGYIRAVKQGTDVIDIIATRPESFDDQVNYLLVELAKYDGLILDWQLDDIPNESGKRVSFRAGALAQEIRTRGTGGEIKELPIVLWSTKPKLSKSYYGDNTSHDLFDVLYDKDEVVDNAGVVREQLISLANGYKRIAHVLSAQHAIFSQMLGLDENDYNLLPSIFTGQFTSDQHYPPHKYARFILDDVISRPGLLISEDLLAARLGIDKNNSSDWDGLLNQLPINSKYNGVFCEAWQRWWSHLVEKKWWRSLAEGTPSLSALSATERVAKLKEHLRLEHLVTAKPIKETYGDRFQTICEFSRQPLDLVDGVIINEKEPKPWQERRYLSLDAALERRGWDDNLRPHLTEMERLREIKKSRTENAEM